MIKQFQEISGWPIQEVKYALQRFKFDINEAIDFMYQKDYKNTYVDQDGVEWIEDQETETPTKPTLQQIADAAAQEIPNLQILEQRKIAASKQPQRQFEIDLHYYGYNEAMEALKVKINQIVLAEYGSTSLLKIVTGRGLHSVSDPVIKIGVLKLLKMNGITHSLQQEAKGGAIISRIRVDLATL